MVFIALLGAGSCRECAASSTTIYTNDKADVWLCSVVYISKERKLNLLIISELQNINLFYKGSPRSEILNYEEYAWIHT